MESFRIANDTKEAIVGGVSKITNTAGVEYKEIGFGKSQQKEESRNFILILLDFFIMFLVIILLFSLLTTIRQKRNRYY